jgi:Predicted flavin-nucleotide-binding protein
MKAKSRRHAIKIKFTVKEIEFLSNNENCRIATVSPDSTPHITPVSYIFQKDMLFFATDYNTKKYNNLKQNPNIALIVDTYSSLKNSAIIIQGKVDFIEQGIKFQKLYKIFDRKFEWVRADPWKESEAPFVQVEPYKKISWGLD